jgi:RNA polymerase sigma factor (sigma-70 family)
MSSQPEPSEVPEDFVPWFRQAGGELYRMAYFCTRDEKLTDEIAQEAVTRIYKAWPDQKKRDKIRTQVAYRWAIVRNCFRDYLRACDRARQGEVELHAGRYSQADPEIVQDVRFAILSLEDVEQNLVILVWYKGLTIGAAGAQLGLSGPQAYRLHVKALAKLAGLLDERKG